MKLGRKSATPAGMRTLEESDTEVGSWRDEQASGGQLGTGGPWSGSIAL